MTEGQPPETGRPDRGSHQQGDWEQEKEREKEAEKEEEKEREKEREKEEKNWEEKWRRDPVSAFSWAVILVWVGVVLLLNNLDLLARYERLETLNLILLGAGVVLLLQVAYRLLVPAHRRPVLGTVILAIVFLSIGLGGFAPIEIIWPALVIVLGLFILWRGLKPRR